MKKWMAQLLVDDPAFAARFRRARNGGAPDAAPRTERDKTRVVHNPRATGGREAREAVLADEAAALADLVEMVGDDGTLADWCRERGLGYTWASTWVKSDPGRKAAYREACETRAQRLIDEIIDIADEEPTRTIATKVGTTIEADAGGIARNAQRIKARQWLAERELRNLYGARQVLEHTGEGGGPVRHVNELPDAQLENIVRLAEAARVAKAREG